MPGSVRLIHPALYLRLHQDCDLDQIILGKASGTIPASLIKMYCSNPETIMSPRKLKSTTKTVLEEYEGLYCLRVAQVYDRTHMLKPWT